MDFGSFCLYGLFWEFYTGVFLSSGFSPIVSSLYQQVLFTDPFAFLLEFTFFIPWSHGVCFLFFWLCFFSYFLVLLEKFLCGEITVSCLLVVNNRDSGYLV